MTDAAHASHAPLGATALIIDDNRLNIEVLKILLDQEGVASVAIDSPDQIDDSLLGRPFDVIFLDLEFPNHNGLDVARSLRQRPALAQVPIVAYTVHSSAIDAARRSGFDGFLGKPIDPLCFSSHLRRILNHEPVWEY